MLDGITLLIGAFFFYCLAHPARVKRERPYWGVLAILLLIVLFNTLRLMLYNSPAGQVFTAICIGVLEATGLVLTVIYVGGLSLREVGQHLKDAAEQLRPEREEKTPIVPIGGERSEQSLKVDENPIGTPIPPRVMIELPKTAKSEAE